MQARVRLTTFLSLIFLLCLNTMPGLDLNEPINWDEIGEFEGEVHELNYDYVWDDGNEGNHRDFSLLFFLYSFIVRAVYLLAMIQLTAKTTTTKMKMAKVKVTATQLKQKQSMANLKQSMANLKQAAVHTQCSKFKGRPLCSKLRKLVTCLKQTPAMKLMLWHLTQVLHCMHSLFYFYFYACKAE